MLYKLPDAKRGTNFSPGMLGGFEPMVIDYVKNREGITDRFAVKWNPRKGTWSGAQAYGGERNLLWGHGSTRRSFIRVQRPPPTSLAT